MDKETSSRVSTIAGPYVHFGQADLQVAMRNDQSQSELVTAIRAMAGSCMSQDQTPGQEQPKGDFYSRLKDEREDLDRRLIALNSYITHNPGHPSPRHHNMLERQAMLMSEFLAVLDERIADIEISRRSENVDGE